MKNILACNIATFLIFIVFDLSFSQTVESAQINNKSEIACQETGLSIPASEIEKENGVLPENISSENSSFELGQTDAVEFFSGARYFYSGLFCGLTIIGLPLAIVSATSPPKINRLRYTENPNDSLIVKNVEYYKGFKNCAFEKKTVNTFTGWFAGSALVWIGLLFIGGF